MLVVYRYTSGLRLRRKMCVISLLLERYRQKMFTFNANLSCASKRFIRAYFIASAAHHDDAPASFLWRPAEAKRLIKTIFNLCHPDERISRRAGPPMIFHLHLPRPHCSLLHHLRTGSELSSQVLQWFGRVRSLNGIFCSAVEDVNHLLWVCPRHASELTRHISALRVAGWPHLFTDDLFFPSWSAGSRATAFRAVIESFKCSSHCSHL